LFKDNSAKSDIFLVDNLKLTKDEVKTKQYEDPKVQKEDIITSIKLKTEEAPIRKKVRCKLCMKRIFKSRHPDECSLCTEDISKKHSNSIQEESINLKLPEDNTDSKKDKIKIKHQFKKDKLKKVKKNNLNKTNKQKIKEEKKRERISKSKCNKPKYKAKHPKECKESSTKLRKVLNLKCQKEKYRKKHGDRCKSLSDSHQSPNEVGVEASNMKCKKEKFRKNFPDLCPNIPSHANQEEDDPDWLQSRCKHHKFRLRNKKECQTLCKQETFSKLYRDICMDEKENINNDQNNIIEEVINDPNNIIDEVINDIKNIVSKENTKQNTSKEEEVTTDITPNSSTTSTPVTTSTVSTTFTTTTTTSFGTRTTHTTTTTFTITTTPSSSTITTSTSTTTTYSSQTTTSTSSTTPTTTSTTSNPTTESTSTTTDSPTTTTPILPITTTTLDYTNKADTILTTAIDEISSEEYNTTEPTPHTTPEKSRK